MTRILRIAINVWLWVLLAPFLGITVFVAGVMMCLEGEDFGEAIAESIVRGWSDPI